MSVARKVAGAWYTPAPLAKEMTERVLGPILAARSIDGAPLRVVDPACGEGAFLVAALDAIEAWYRARDRRDARAAIAERHLFGCERDARAAAKARAIGANVAHGDALLEVAWERGSFDAVLGNPPYVEAAVLAARDPEWRARVQARYAAARGNWDLFCPFVELAIDLAKPGGAIGLIVPNKIASAEYARATRAIVASRARVTWTRPVDGAFDAAVYPVAFTAERLTTDLVCETDASWRGTRSVALAGTPLGELATITGAATVAEAYAMRDLVVDGGEGIKVVNSGTIDPDAILWGVRPMRYLGATYARPVVRAIDRLPPRRLAQARAPKIVVAGLSRRLECALDANGEYLAAKSTCVITSDAIDLARLVRFLNGAEASAWFRATYAGNALAGGYLRVGPKQLAAIPIPSDVSRARA